MAKKRNDAATEVDENGKESNEALHYRMTDGVEDDRKEQIATYMAAGLSREDAEALS